MILNTYLREPVSRKLLWWWPGGHVVLRKSAYITRVLICCHLTTVCLFDPQSYSTYLYIPHPTTRCTPRHINTMYLVQTNLIPLLKTPLHSTLAVKLYILLPLLMWRCDLNNIFVTIPTLEGQINGGVLIIGWAGNFLDI